jgi:hypothetical protein
MKPTGILKDELLDELIAKERLISKMKDALKADVKRQKEKIGAVEQRRDEVLDLLEGKKHDQPALPFGGAPGKDGKKPTPPELVWDVQGENDVAETPAGTYCIESSNPGSAKQFVVSFTPPKGKTKKLGEEYSRPLAKQLARNHWVELAANAILENAGDGKLTGKIRGLEKVK